MSYDVNYRLVRPSMSWATRTMPLVDRMAPVSTMNRIANVACERIILMMNNTRMLKQHRLSSMDQVIMYLYGDHDDVGCAGDRGDFWRRKLAEQIYLNFSVHGVDHTNIMQIVGAAILLRKHTGTVLSESARSREIAPPIDIDDKMLDILARIADIH